MNENEAKKFSANWQARGYEKGETIIFWTQLLQNVFGIDDTTKIFSPEKQVKIDGTTHFIDIFFPKTKVLVEQKSFGENLDDAFTQAKNYAENLPYSERPKWIVTCNFSEFQIFNLDCMDFPEKYRENYLMTHANDIIPPTDDDVENAIKQPTKIFLENLSQNLKNLEFLFNPDIEMILPDVQISTAAAKIVQKIFTALQKNFQKNSTQNFSANIEKICTRLVFCFYANDANIFPQKIFDYLKNFPDSERNSALQNLFEILNTPENLRDKNLPENLKNFPYVNGGLFEEKISLPAYNKFVENPINTALTFDAGKNFSWQTINPTIFGAMFESILNPEVQRKGGMHFTSVENIHKVIDPLFLDDLHEKFLKIKRKRKDKFLHLKNFQEEIAALKFFDPACGSGNFLTETYISLRRLENQILEEIKKILGELPENPVKVSIENFFGVEIYSFAVAVAKTALWIAENQMLQETKILTQKNLYELPLKKITNIHCANALTLDWEKILPDDLNFIIGNPPFVGKTFQSREQKADLAKFFPSKNVDYVACWFKKAAEFLFYKNSNSDNFRFTKIPDERLLSVQKVFPPTFIRTKSPQIECAFVSTNSITQGEQVAAVWENLGVEINFAHRTFKWQSESEHLAAVHCVIISFANFSRAQKIIFDGDKKILAENINPYLQDAPNIFIHSRKFPLQKNIPQMINGGKPVDGGNLILSEDEKNYFLEKYPESKKFIRKFIMGRDFLHDEKRFCFWFVDYSLEEIKKFPEIYSRVEKVKKFRLESQKISTQKSAETPQLFQEIIEVEKNYIAIPKVSSENRKYIPMDFLSAEIKAGDKIFMIPDANLFHFGVLTSSVHNIWTKNFCGRLTSRISYSSTLIYNNFVWCESSAENVKKISETAEKILRVRKKYQRISGLADEQNSEKNSNQLISQSANQLQDWTLAKLYNEATMPEDLRRAHEENDLAVKRAYGFENFSEKEILRELMTLYKNLTNAE